MKNIFYFLGLSAFLNTYPIEPAKIVVDLENLVGSCVKEVAGKIDDKTFFLVYHHSDPDRLESSAEARLIWMTLNNDTYIVTNPLKVKIELKRNGSKCIHNDKNIFYIPASIQRSPTTMQPNFNGKPFEIIKYYPRQHNRYLL